MANFSIPVIWAMKSSIEVEADTLTDAILKVKNGNYKLPEDGDYIEDSFQIDGEDELGDDIDELVAYINELYY